MRHSRIGVESSFLIEISLGRHERDPPWSCLLPFGACAVGALPASWVCRARASGAEKRTRMRILKVLGTVAVVIVLLIAVLALWVVAGLG